MGVMRPRSVDKGIETRGETSISPAALALTTHLGIPARPWPYWIYSLIDGSG
jgi:hypothetical protein